MEFIRPVILGFAAALSLGSSIARADDGVLQAIKSRGVLRACEAEYLPWNQKDPATNTWVGVNIDIGEEIAQALKVKLEHVDTTFATLMTSIVTGKCDLSLSAVWITPARAELVTFTRPYAQDGISVFIPMSATANSLDDIDQPGKTIVARAGGADLALAQRIFKHATVKALTADRAGIALMEVASGRADAAMGGYYGNLAFLKGNPNVNVKPLPNVLLAPSPIALAVAPKEYFFRDYVNTVLSDMEATGRLKAIIDKWTK